MKNSINLLPLITEDKVKKENKKLKYDVIMGVAVSIVVLGAIVLVLADSFIKNNTNVLSEKISQDTVTLKTYTPFISQYSVLKDKVEQTGSIKKQGLDPNSLIDYLISIAPPNTTFSNLTLSANNKFTVSVSNSDYINIAKFLIVFEDPKLQVKGVTLSGIAYSTNQLSFNLSGNFVQNGNR